MQIEAPDRQMAYTAKDHCALHQDKNTWLKAKSPKKRDNCTIYLPHKHLNVSLIYWHTIKIRQAKSKSLRALLSIVCLPNKIIIEYIVKK